MYLARLLFFWIDGVSCEVVVHMYLVLSANGSLKEWSFWIGGVSFEVVVHMYLSLLAKMNGSLKEWSF